jgi:L-ascorbate metabolism protein UlaG (beta-lactamase superfamily)
VSRQPVDEILNGHLCVVLLATGRDADRGDEERADAGHHISAPGRRLRHALAVRSSRWRSQARAHVAQSTDHFDGKRFVNPTGTAGQPFSAVARMLREPRTPWPRGVEVEARQPPPLGDAAATVTFIGHSTFLIQTRAGNLLTDPMYGDRAGPFGMLGPRRVRPAAVRFEDLPSISAVLLSHNHYDHCDLPTLRKLARRFDPIVVTPLGNGRLVRSAGIRRVEELDWWQQAARSSVPITLTPAYHFSARGPFDKNRALWGGFALMAGGRRLYFAGDTAYGPFFREIPERVGPIDLALLPIGAYEPRWFMHVVHMNPLEAVRAHLDLGAPETIGMHFGTFQLTTEGIDDPVRALHAALHADGAAPDRFRVLDFGESISL